MAYTTIDDPEAYFQVRAFTGNQGTLAVTLDGDTDMLPTMVWIKPRETASYGTKVWDSVRGVTDYIETNSNGVEGEGLSGVDSFDSDGFTLGSYRGANDSAGNIAWCWKETADAGFDIVTYTGNETARTISHSLSAVPHFIIVKNRDSARSWTVGSKGMPSWSYHLYLDTSDDQNSDDNMFNGTTPTSSVFSLGNATETNETDDKMIAYLWSEKQGFSKFGSYIGNGAADGTFVYLGFRPAFVLAKNTTDGHNWWCADNKRDTFNVMGKLLRLDVANAETSGTIIDFLSNGFKLRETGTDRNESAANIIYMAFAEQPFVNSNGVPANAR